MKILDDMDPDYEPEAPPEPEKPEAKKPHKAKE